MDESHRRPGTPRRYNCLAPPLATRIRGKQVRPDGTLRDEFNLHRAYWAAKDLAGKCVPFARFRASVGATEATFDAALCASVERGQRATAGSITQDRSS